MTEESALPEREKTAFEPKSVVANSGKPRKVNTWARQFMGWCMRAPMEARIAAAAIAGVKRMAPTKAERADFAKIFRERHLWGRRGNGSGTWPWQFGWRGGRDPNHNGEREIARRRSQIERGLLSPVYRERPGALPLDRYERAA